MFDVIQDGIERGGFRKELPVQIISMAIFGMINWIYKWYQKRGQYTIQEIADIYGDIILHSILTKEAKENWNFSKFFLKSYPRNINLEENLFEEVLDGLSDGWIE